MATTGTKARMTCMLTDIRIQVLDEYYLIEVDGSPPQRSVSDGDVQGEDYAEEKHRLPTTSIKRQLLGLGGLRGGEVYLRPDDVAGHVHHRQGIWVLEVHLGEGGLVQDGDEDVVRHPDDQP